MDIARAPRAFMSALARSGQIDRRLPKPPQAVSAETANVNEHLAAPFFGPDGPRQTGLSAEPPITKRPIKSSDIR
jgi:hypothetical protein